MPRSHMATMSVLWLLLLLSTAAACATSKTQSSRTIRQQQNTDTITRHAATSKAATHAAAIIFDVMLADTMKTTPAFMKSTPAPSSATAQGGFAALASHAALIASRHLQGRVLITDTAASIVTTRDTTTTRTEAIETTVANTTKAPFPFCLPAWVPVVLIAVVLFAFCILILRHI